MKKQMLISETDNGAFTAITNAKMRSGWKVVPGCLHVTAMRRSDDKFFSITLWKDGIEKFISAPDFKSFIEIIEQDLSNGFFVVVGSIYTESILNLQPAEDDSMTRYYFNVIGEE